MDDNQRGGETSLMLTRVDFKMPFSATCSNCNTKVQAKDELAGHTVTCPKCKQALKIGTQRHAGQTVAGTVAAQKDSLPAQPTELAATSQTTPTDTPQAPSERSESVQESAAGPKTPQRKALSQTERQQQILAGFTAPIERVRPPMSYRLGIMIVSVAMVILPLIYILLIIATGCGIYYHLTHNVEMLSYGSGRGKAMVALAYIAPLIAGAVMVVFMIKPLFARPAKAGNGRSLTPDEEPILFKFVEKLCKTVGAPMPTRIDVDGEVNASASFRRGMLSVITGNDLVLTIGMPLAAGMSARQLTGVLAHEFGHFSQGAGMRLTFLVRSISMWFTRVVYERDSWDETLEAAADGLDIRLAWIVYVARGCVWLSRRVLWCLMMVGHMVSGLLLRQMEFDADRYEARVVGSRVFDTTCRRLGQVGVAYQATIASLQQFFNEGKLADNLPKLIEHNLEELSDETKTKLAEIIDSSETGWLDTHPADKDRIASADREQADGVFRWDGPASDLFCRYDQICKDVTWDFYQQSLGDKIKREDLKPIDDLLVHQRQQKANEESLQRFLNCPLRPDRTFPLTSAHLQQPADVNATVQQLKDARSNALTEHKKYQAAASTFGEADNELLQATAALGLFRTNITVPTGVFKTNNVDDSQKWQAAASAKVDSCEKKMEAFEQAIGARLVADLRLLFVPQVAEKIEDAERLQRQANALLPLAERLGNSVPTVIKFRNQFVRFSALLGQVDRYSTHEPLLNSLLADANELNESLRSIQNTYAETDYPFDHADKDATLGAYFVQTLPQERQVGLTHNVGADFLEKFATVYHRTIGTIVMTAEKVENSLGLPALFPDVESSKHAKSASEER